MKLGPFEFGLARRETVSPPAEARSNSLENPAISLTDPAAWRQVWGEWMAASGVTVTPATALGVPAFGCGVGLLAELFASLPFQEFEKSGAGFKAVETGALAGMLDGTVNDDFLTCYDWRKGKVYSYFTTGAARTWIERNRAGQPVNLWPLETFKTQKFRRNGRTGFRYTVTGQRTVEYDVADVIDWVWMPQLDGLGHYNPLERYRDTLGLGIAIEQYGSRYFQGGGVPPIAVESPLGSPAANARAKTDINAAIRQANESGDPTLLLPPGVKLTPLGFDPAKGQLVEAKKLNVIEIARILNIPPVVLHDLTNGSFSNTEQQGLSLAKTSLTPRIEGFEAQCNAKFYGPRNARKHVEMNLDALLRGDFAARMTAYSKAIQNAVLQPNEARAMERRAPVDGGDRLFIQGATVPLDMAGAHLAPGATAPTPILDEPVDPAAET